MSDMPIELMIELGRACPVPIDGYDDRYLITNDYRIFSCVRETWVKVNKRGQVTLHKKGSRSLTRSVSGLLVRAENMYGVITEHVDDEKTYASIKTDLDVIYKYILRYKQPISKKPFVSELCDKFTSYLNSCNTPGSYCINTYAIQKKHGYGCTVGFFKDEGGKSKLVANYDFPL